MVWTIQSTESYILVFKLLNFTLNIFSFYTFIHSSLCMDFKKIFILHIYLFFTVYGFEEISKMLFTAPLKMLCYIWTINKNVLKILSGLLTNIKFL